MKRIFKIKVAMKVMLSFDWFKHLFNCASGVSITEHKCNPKGCSQWVDSNGLLVLKSPLQKVLGWHKSSSLWCGILSSLELEIQHGPFVLPNVPYWCGPKKFLDFVERYK
jgi:hypothetical protein